MPVDRKQFPKAAQRFFSNLDDWQPDPVGFVNLYRQALSEAEADRKVGRYPDVVALAADQARARIDAGVDKETIIGRISAKINNAALYYLFTGDRKALRWADDGLKALEAYERPNFTYITLVDRVDVDLRTAGVARALAAVKSCFGDALDDRTARRVDRLAVDRCLRPALEAFRTRKYWWTECRHNWRSVMAGSFAIGAMAFADVFDEWRELAEYGLEGVLVVLEEGDREGGWQEGPGYWEYGVGHCADFAADLKRFTGGKVDLFKHRYLKRTGDFRIYMTATPGRVWNWSDGHKAAGNSATLCLLAREYANPVYQAAALDGGVASIRHLLYLDLDLKRKPPEPAEGFPLTKAFPDIGVTAMRTGFGKGDAYVGVKAGNLGPGVNHEHADLGSVVIHAGGRELLAELDGWPYAQSEGKAGGFFDKGGRRWDYDFNGPASHNLVLLEGVYPPFGKQARATVKHFDLGRNVESVLVDSTAMHRALARRVRRYVVYLRPDTVLLVDEIQARDRSRARCLFHYLDRAEVEADSFTISSGGAALRGVSLHPSLEHNIIIGKDEQKVAYHTERGIVERTVSRVYTSNLHRSKDLVFVTGLVFGRKPLRTVRWALEGEVVGGKPFTVSVGRRRLTIDLTARKADDRIVLAG